MKSCKRCHSALTVKDDNGLGFHKTCPTLGLPSKRSHDPFPRIRADLIQQRSIVMQCMREVAEKLERGDLNYDVALDGAAAAITGMKRMTRRARVELED